MARKQLPTYVDTVVVGNGPSALILSFILHGNFPYYDSTNPHPDSILHQKLINSPCLLEIDINDLTAHFGASRLSYSTQALPVNVLLDTLLRPLADTNPGQYETCIEWRYEPKRRIEHVVLGNAAHSGGQWADNPVEGSWDIGALSYAEMLSLPGYSLLDHLQKTSQKPVEEFHRPSRREVADYLKVYPARVGIENAIHTNITVRNVCRTEEGFYIQNLDLRCKRLVLASGTFSTLVPARPLLQPLLRLPSNTLNNLPLLVVGSGFTAADVIISAPPQRKIIHIFKWEPDLHPSPLRACHPRAYPEYASIYRRMKLAAKKHLGSKQVFSPMRRKSNPFEGPQWEDFYEGLPNTYIKAVETRPNHARITLENSNGETFERDISSLQYVIGRRGSLEYLDTELLSDALRGSPSKEGTLIAGKTLRSKAEESLEIAQDVFITGSLTGDSLIRFAFGGCVYVARELMRREKFIPQNEDPSVGPAVESRTEAASLHQLDIYPEQAKRNYEYTNGHFEFQSDMKVLA